MLSKLALLLSVTSLSVVLFSTASWAHTQGELSQFLKKTQAKARVVKPPQGLLKYEYLTPSGPYYQLFDWDMYFMGVALSYEHLWKPVAGSVRDFLEYVDDDVNVHGYAPRIISPEKLWALPHQCKPFLAQAALLAAGESGQWQWLKPLYPKLRAMLEFWEDSRRANDGLFIWYDGLESGVDNSPAFASETGKLDTEGVDLQVYLYREYLAVALIGKKLGDLKGAENLRSKAEDLSQLMIEKMWNEGDGTFYNVNARTGRQIKVNAWTNFTPLWAKMVPHSYARRMIEEHLLNKAEFWAEHGIRTTALHESKYDPRDGYWLGPVWVISNFMSMHGLMNYGYKSQAQELAQKTVDLLVDDLSKTHGMNECYNPETGAPTAGDHFVSWNLLAEHMLEESASGYDPSALK